jgi:uncharacterized protein (UPF0276 family)
MELAINFSPQAAQLHADRRIRVDRFKCPDWPDMIEEARALAPVYVHFPLDAGTTSGRPVDLDAVEAMAHDTDTPLVNYHFVSYARDFPGEAFDTADRNVTATIIDRAASDLAVAIDRFGAGRIVLENIPYFAAAGSYMRASVEPAVLRRVIDDAGCGFLLDLAHARIAAHYLGVDPRAYVESLPLDRLRELHVTGVDWVDGKLLDHMGLADEDLAWTRWALDRIAAGDWPKPALFAFEYGGTGEPFNWRTDPQVIERDVNRLNEMIACL